MWGRGGNAEADGRFASCHDDGDMPVLSYQYAAGESVGPTVDTSYQHSAA